MARVLGIGGYFIRSRDPKSPAAWYAEKLGIATMDPDGSGGPWQQEAGHTVFSTFAQNSAYLGRPEQQTMLNFRVDNLDDLVASLRAADVLVDDKVDELEGIGRFGWATDPEGNRFELWEPAAGI